MLCHYVECCYAEFRVLFMFMLNVIMLSVVNLIIMAPSPQQKLLFKKNYKLYSQMWQARAIKKCLENIFITKMHYLSASLTWPPPVSRPKFNILEKKKLEFKLFRGQWLSTGLDAGRLDAQHNDIQRNDISHTGTHHNGK
jgi:hypothetical protein